MDQEKIGKLIKELRQKHHLTQQEFADQFGVTFQAVSKWETGKNMPDIVVLKAICDRYELDMNDLFSEKKSRKKRRSILLVLGVVLVFSGGILCLWKMLTPPNSFEFKTIEANCENFTITGSIAYNENKSSIYISNIHYCGEKENTSYIKMECTLFESNGKTNTKIDDYKEEVPNGITLEKFLNDVTFHVQDYAKTCKSYTENSLFLEINAQTKDGKRNTYKIPLQLNENCNTEKTR